MKPLLVRARKPFWTGTTTTLIVATFTLLHTNSGSAEPVIQQTATTTTTPTTTTTTAPPPTVAPQRIVASPTGGFTPISTGGSTARPLVGARRVLPVVTPVAADMLTRLSPLTGISITRHAYGTHTNQWLKVFRLTDATKRNGRFIVWFHGGSWSFGTPDTIANTTGFNDAPLLMDLVHRGWTVVGVQHRFASTTVHVEQIIDDVVTSIHWAHTKLGARPATTIAMGQSSGAYLALAAGTRSTPIVAGWVGVELPSDFAAINRMQIPYGSTVLTFGTLVANMLTCPVRAGFAQCTAERYAATNGATLVRIAGRSAQPAYITSSLNDEVAPPAIHVEPVMAALMAAGAVRSRLDPVEGALHNQAAGKLNYRVLRGWLEQRTGLN